MFLLYAFPGLLRESHYHSIIKVVIASLLSQPFPALIVVTDAIKEAKTTNNEYKELTWFTNDVLATSNRQSRKDFMRLRSTYYRK